MLFRSDQGALGVTFAALPLGTDLQRDPLEAAEVGLRRLVQTSTLILRGAGDLIAHLGDPPVAGPVGMVQSVGAIRTSWPPVFLVWFIGMLSANLAVIDLLPFPPMDGGRVALAVNPPAFNLVAADCAADRVFDFCLTSAPLNLRGGVGSPPNALAIK